MMGLGWGAACWEGVILSPFAVGYSFFLPPAVRNARSLKNYFTLTPVFAETSIKGIPNFLNYSDDKFVCTALYSSRSFLLPIIKINASSPLTSLTLSIHLDRLWYELASTNNNFITCNIVHNNSRITILNIRRYKWMKSFLSSSIPQLHSQAFILDINSFRNKINSNSWLSNNILLPVHDL